ncbi:MAG TPA: NAD-dependent malic enzyme [Puia sp.]|nr:NAD-dependent malic enzyme [Puia sp.]
MKTVMDEKKKKPAAHLGVDLLRDPYLNKGTAFSIRERQELKLEGLLPAVVEGIEEQVQRVMNHLRLKPNDLERYIYMIGLLDRNETLFFKVLMSDPARFVPIMYDPTVGEACLKFSDIYRRNGGMYVTIEDKGRVKDILRNWPEKDVRFICVSTGGRILGLGDLGANGMGIPLGKLQLYTACAAVPPEKLLPLLLDCGTDNDQLLKNPLYIGVRRHRPEVRELDAFVQEFVDAVQEVFPGCCIHFEDWKGTDAIRLLKRYKDKICCYNDDIQGTAGVAVAGLIGAMNISRGKLSEQRVLMFGAGSAGIGIANMITAGMQAEGLSNKDAASRIALFDVNGLLTKGRTDLSDEQSVYAVSGNPTKSLVEAIRTLKSTVLIGVSTVGKTFTREVVQAMTEQTARPVIFALSNPTDHAECSAQEAYEWSNGKAIYAAGVPFDEVKLGDKVFIPGQANNYYLFPGVSLGIYAAKPKLIPDALWIEGARALADLVTPQQKEKGMVFPPQKDILAISTSVAERVARMAFDKGLAQEKKPKDLAAFIRELQYQPDYSATIKF